MREFQMVERESYKEGVQAGGRPRHNTPGSRAPKIIPEQRQKVKRKFNYFLHKNQDPNLCKLSMKKSVDKAHFRVYN